jgi:DNA-binding XRE family transcriptional regulator
VVARPPPHRSGQRHLVGQAITAPLEEGPSLGRPLVDRIKGATLHNPKELRPGSAGLVPGGESFLSEFFPESEDRAEVEAGAEALINVNRAHRLAEMRKRLGLTQAEVAERMKVRQERVSAIERAKVDTSELRTLAAYIRALGGRLELVADFGGERLVVG